MGRITVFVGTPDEFHANMDLVPETLYRISDAKMRPHEIRTLFAKICEEAHQARDARTEDEEPVSAEERDIVVVTLNRTVLDTVGRRESSLIGYEHVVFARDEGHRLERLLDLHDEDWLSHFALGDLFANGGLEAD